jgi:hypothetical protein
MLINHRSLHTYDVPEAASTTPAGLRTSPCRWGHHRRANMQGDRVTARAAAAVSSTAVRVDERRTARVVPQPHLIHIAYEADGRASETGSRQLRVVRELERASSEQCSSRLHLQRRLRWERRQRLEAEARSRGYKHRQDARSYSRPG